MDFTEEQDGFHPQPVAHLNDQANRPAQLPAIALTVHVKKFIKPLVYQAVMDKMNMPQDRCQILIHFAFRSFGIL